MCSFSLSPIFNKLLCYWFFLCYFYTRILIFFLSYLQFKAFITSRIPYCHGSLSQFLYLSYILLLSYSSFSTLLMILLCTSKTVNSCHLLSKLQMSSLLPKVLHNMAPKISICSEGLEIYLSYLNKRKHLKGYLSITW